MLRIGEMEFAVSEAYLEAYIVGDNDDCIDWGLKVKTIPTDKSENWNPQILSEGFITTQPLELKTWLDLAGKKVTWDECYDEEKDVQIAVLYIFGHDDIFNAAAEFIKNDEGGLTLKMKGTSNIGWKEPYDVDIDFELETPVGFKGIWCGRKTEEEARAEVSKAMNIEVLEFTKTEHDVSLYVPKG